MEEPPDEIRPERGALSIAKARKLLGYVPEYTIEQGIPQYIEFVKNTALKDALAKKNVESKVVVEPAKSDDLEEKEQLLNELSKDPKFN